MNKGILIYNREDYNKNTWFAESFVKNGPLYNMNISIVLTDEIMLSVEKEKMLVKVKGKNLEKPDFVINRSRDSLLGFHFELMDCRVFNSSLVTEICNNKAKTHQVINSKEIKSVNTFLCNKKYFQGNYFEHEFPLILKTVSGHGGNEVYKLDNINELNNKIAELKNDEFILQEMCTNPGKDIRVFVLGKEIIGAVKRHSAKSFKSNFSLGGEAEKYELKPNEKALTEKIMSILSFDFVGIDFILDKENNFLFNEIEDVVGTRTLYKNYDIDIVKKYLEYIRTCIA